MKPIFRRFTLTNNKHVMINLFDIISIEENDSGCAIINTSAITEYANHNCSTSKSYIVQESLDEVVRVLNNFGLLG